MAISLNLNDVEAESDVRAIMAFAVLQNNVRRSINF